MKKIFIKIAVVLIGIMAFSISSKAQFREEAFTQNYNSPNDTTVRDTADVLFSFKQFYRGVTHKEKLKIGTMFGGSTLFIGAEQIYNKQYWKLPLVYGGLGATIGLGIHYNNKYKDSKAAYNADFAINGDQTTLKVDYHSRDMRKYMFAGAAFIYWATLMDGVVNYDKDNPNHQPGKATLYSILVPGLGQVYNGEYWKVPIYWSCLIGSAHFIVTNNTNYHRYKNIHNEATDPDSEYDGPVSAETAKYYRDVFRRYRDYSIVAFLGFYILQAIDANVFAYMRDFEVTDDISMSIEPDIQMPQYNSYAFAPQTNSLGLKIGFRF